VIPFRLTLRSGTAICDQVVYAAKKAIVSGQICAGHRFPSVRALSKALKINPNTAHKVVGFLVAEGLLKVRPGIGTVVANLRGSTTTDRNHLLRGDLERIVVDARQLGLGLDEVAEALAHHWSQLDPTCHELRRKA